MARVPKKVADRFATGSHRPQGALETVLAAS